MLYTVADNPFAAGFIDGAGQTLISHATTPLVHHALSLAGVVVSEPILRIATLWGIMTDVVLWASGMHSRAFGYGSHSILNTASVRWLISISAAVLTYHWQAGFSSATILACAVSFIAARVAFMVLRRLIGMPHITY